jgi:TatA/E family protein of Tat protein translocase
MFGLSGWEILIVVVVALLVFGKRLPAIMRRLGSSAHEFRKGMSGEPAAATPNPQDAPMISANIQPPVRAS